MSSLANWTGNFKQRYGRFINPLPEEQTIADFAEFVQQDYRPGLGYNFPVVVGNEHGQTANLDNTAFAFNAAIDSVVKNATLDGATLGIVGNVPYDVSFRGNNGAADGSRGGAFWKPYDLKVKMLVQSANLYQELLLLYGCGGTDFTTPAANIGVIATSPAPSGNLGAGNTSAITVATNSPGIWNQMIGALIDLHNGATPRETGITVTGYNPATGVLSLSKAASAVTPVAGDLITPTGWKQKSAVGLQAIGANTGTLFGLAAGTYPMWQVVQISAGGAMTRDVILGMAARLHSNGLTGGGKLFVCGATFGDLVKQTFELQRWQGNDGKVKRQGAGVLLYETAVGVIEVTLHRYMKQGIAMFFPHSGVKRVGSTPITFKGDGPNEFFFLELPSNAGYQLRAMQNQAPVIEIPYHAAYITGIVNSATSGATGGS